LNITSIKIKELDYDKLKGQATVTIDNELVLTGIKVFQGSNGLFVAMPSVKGREGEIDDYTKKQKYYDTFYPCSAEARTQLTEAVLAKFSETATVKPNAGSEAVEIDEMDTDLPF